MMTDPAQRALLRCVLEDALDLHLAPLQDCPGCEHWIERGPCARHQAGHEIWARYLGLSARLEAAAPLLARPLGPHEARVVIQAIPDALARRHGSLMAVDAGLRAAYTTLAAAFGR